MADRDSNTTLRLVVGLVLLLVAIAARGCEYQLAQNKAAEREAQEAAKTEQECADAKAIQDQPYDTLGLRFLDTDKTQQCTLNNTLTFLVPEAWAKDKSYMEDEVTSKANIYTGLLGAGIERDVCLFSTSDEEAIDTLANNLDFLIIDRAKGESGTVGNARWHRFPVSVAKSSKGKSNCPHGLLEIVLSGHDAYHIYTLCYAREYTSQIHEEMLRILNSVDGDFEEPLLLTNKVGQTANEGTLLNFLQKLDEFATYTVRGTGAQTFDLPRGGDLQMMSAQCLLDVIYQGTGPFSVSARSIVDGYEDHPLVEANGPYSGTVTNMYNGEGFLSYRQLSVDAQGDWEITLSPISSTPQATKGKTYPGDAVLYLDEDSLASLSLAHSGGGKFVVYAAGMSESKQLVDTTGDYSGSVEWSDPHTLLLIHSEGEWSIDWTKLQTWGQSHRH